jgi:hypothetical protein
VTTPTAPSAAAQAAVVRGEAVWLPPGSPPVTVAGYVITGGLVYLGSAVAAAYAPTYEPALIDPRAPVRRIRLDQETPAEDARPAYGDLTPGARAAYLEWLVGGRTDPAPAAHLWLFLYGLERRVLVDLAGSLTALAEYAAIAAEVAALRERYPHQPAFDAKAAEFADLLDALIGLGDPSLQPPPAGPRTGELPMRLRVGLGRYVARGLPVSAGWAYAWYAYSPYRVWGPAATRRPEEFRRAFAARYAQAYPGGGLAVPAPDDGLVLAYLPANPGFADRTVRIHTQLPDVRGLTEPLAELASVATLAEADLSGGPVSARPPAGTQPAATASGDEPAPTTTEEPASPAGTSFFFTPAARRPQTARTRRPETAAPPDPTATEPIPAPEPEPVVGPVREQAAPPAGDRPRADDRRRRVRPDARPQVAAAEALLRLVILAGIADGYVRAVRRYVVDALSLTADERHTLDDRLDRFARQRPDYTIVRRRFAALRPEQQRAVTDLLIAAAGAEGVVEPEQAAVLAAVFELLGPGAADLHRRLRDMEVAAVVGESVVDTTVLDEEVVETTLAGAVTSAALVDGLVAPAQRYAACP